MQNEAWKENAARLKAWRKEKGLTQDAAAKAVGAAQKSWDEWEDGEKVPTLGFIVEIERLTEGAVPAIGWLGRVRCKPGTAPKRKPSSRRRAAVGT